MTSSHDDDKFPIDDLEGLQDCLEDPSLASLMRIDSNEKNLSVNLDAVRQSMLQSLSTSPSTCLTDRALLDSLPLASKLFIESINETENSLSRDSSAQTVGSKLSLWKNSLEPWYEFLKHVKNLGTVPAPSIQGLLDFVPGIIQIVFTHCKRSESLYKQKFDDLLPQLTSLFRQTSSVLDLFFSILGNNVDFETEVKTEQNSLKTVLDTIGDIAVLTNGMDLKTQLNTWKAFAKLAAAHEVILKKLVSTSCITRRYVDMAKDIQALLFDSLKDNKETNYERRIKCAAMLLKILVRLCTLYRGYSGNKVFIVLVQLLTKLHRYMPPFTSERFIHAHSKIGEYLATHIVPTMGELLNAIVDENEFRKAFFEYRKSELEDRIDYHLLTLRIMEELLKRQRATLSLWTQENSNIIDVALTNATYCCEDLLIDKLRIPIRSEVVSREIQHLGIYQMTLRLLCQFIARTSAEDFAAIEGALLKHLLSGEFWSCLLSCDSWTYLARIASPDLCAEHLSFLIKVQKPLTTRENSLEFGILSNLIGRLYKLLPVDQSSTREETKFTLFREIEDYTNRRLVDPFWESLPPRARQYLWQLSTIDTTSNLSTTFQEFRRSPSVKNWTRLTSLLRSIGALANPKDERLCIVTLRTIWSFVAANVPKSEGVTRDMLLELTTFLFDCTRPDCDKNSNNDWLLASIYKNMFEMTDHLPIQHRIRMNVFLRANLKSFANQSGKHSLPSITELFCCLVSNENPWVRQESFETYAEHILKGPSSKLFDSLSLGISKLPRINRQITSYFSNTPIYDLTHYSSLDNYLRELAESSRDHSTWHECYEPDFRTRDEKMPRLEVDSLDERICDICNELENVVKRRNDLSSDTTDRLRLVLIKLLEP